MHEDERIYVLYEKNMNILTKGTLLVQSCSVQYNITAGMELCVFLFVDSTV